MPRLSLLLRCDHGVSGTITVAGGGIDSRRLVDAAKACAAGSIDLADYEQGRDLQVAFARNGSESDEIAVVYGRDIQTSPEGFFAVLRLRMLAPLIANERL